MKMIGYVRLIKDYYVAGPTGCAKTKGFEKCSELLGNRWQWLPSRLDPTHYALTVDIHQYAVQDESIWYVHRTIGYDFYEVDLGRDSIRFTKLAFKSLGRSSVSGLDNGIKTLSIFDTDTENSMPLAVGKRAIRYEQPEGQTIGRHEQHR